MSQAMTAVMTSAERNQIGPPVLSSVAEFRGWLARTGSCPWFEYHRGLLIWDRSPQSELSDDDRRMLGKIANAVFQAAEQGRVHLVQRRNGPFDFSYLAIKSVRAATRRVLAIDHAPAQRSPLCSEAA
jgi:hypothetical protein